MKLKVNQRLLQILRWSTFFLFGCSLGIICLYGLFRLSNRGQVYSGVLLGTNSLFGLSREKASLAISENLNNYQLVITDGSRDYVVPKDLFSFDILETTNRAYFVGRSIDYQSILKILGNKEQKIQAKVTIEDAKLNAWIDTIAPEVEVLPISPIVEIKNGDVMVTTGGNGTLIEKDMLTSAIKKSAQFVDGAKLTIPVRPINKELSDNEMKELSEIAKGLLDKKVVIKVDDNEITLEGAKIISFLSTDKDKIGSFVPSIVENYVISIAETYDRPSQNAKFEVIDNKVKEFAPGKDGLVIKVNDTKQALTKALEVLLDGQDLQTISAVYDLTPPEVETEDVNTLGINKRIGRGESYYAHSIPGRVHNVALTGSRITGTLIAPGEEFSFNKTVGEISGATGYAPAYIIKNGRTELGDGGGVCQVSTTVFRAAMASGLPIVERWAHAYRVGYYEQQSEPGIDATVFSPSKDLRFLNDTPGHLLVQVINDPKKMHMVVEIYGTDDGRIAEIGKVKVWGQTAPPPDLYQDDPTLPLGKLKQVDWSAWGAKTTFDYKVTRNGETIFEKSFPSTYRAWQNVYLRGTAGQ